MQKKLMVMTIATALSTPAMALADVTVYGKADLATGVLSNGTTKNAQISSQVTKMGFKGAEKLDEGFSLNWQIEQQIDMDGAGTAFSGHVTFAGRNSFLALKHDDFGTFMLGRHDTPYKVSTRHLDVFGDQFADNRHLMGGDKKLYSGSLMDARPGNEIMYISPKWSGVSVSASLVPKGENAGSTSDVKSQLYSVSASYNNGPLLAAAAYQDIEYGTKGQFTFDATKGDLVGSKDHLKAAKAGIGYTMSQFKVTAVIERFMSSGTTVGNKLTRTDIYVGGIYKFGKNDVKLAVTSASNANGVSNTGAKMFAAGVDHSLSKKTTVYAQGVLISNDSKASYGFNGAATTANTASVAAGKNPYGVLVGMKHVF